MGALSPGPLDLPVLPCNIVNKPVNAWSSVGGRNLTLEQKQDLTTCTGVVRVLPFCTADKPAAVKDSWLGGDDGN